jgi:cell division protein FtsQ
VKPARRRGPWRTLGLALMKYATLLGVIAFALYRGTSVVAQARMLRIDRIAVRGNVRLSSGEVLAVLNGLRGENIVWTDLRAWRRRLLASPWVRDASLRRSLPSTIEVAVVEREPIGIGRVNGTLYLVDERGSVIDEYGPQYADFDLPVIDGLAPPHGPAAIGDDPHAELAARLLVAIRAKPAVLQRVSQVDVRDVHNAAVLLTGDPALVYLGEDRFLPRLQSYLELASALRERVSSIDYVDLRFDDRIYVRPASGASPLRRVRPDDATTPRRRDSGSMGEGDRPPAGASRGSQTPAR